MINSTVLSHVNSIVTTHRIATVNSSVKSSLITEKLAFTKSTLDNYKGTFSTPKDLEGKAKITTDLDDYAPGSTAIINGDNFQPGETVELQILHTDGTPNTGGGHNPWRVTDGGWGDLDGTVNGKFETNWYVNPDDSAGSAFELTGTGLTSNQIATFNFTDAGNPFPVQTYYVPLPEANVQTTLGNLYSGTGSTINSVISITSTTNDTFVYYDHWEDGYEVDISNPAQSSTQVWGDGDLTNGTAPGTSDDLLDEGDIVALENEVTLPRNSADIKYDGRDKIASSKAISVSRSAWATSPGTVLAGAVEVYDTAKYGTSFEIPIGQNVSSGQAFEYTSLSVTAASDGTEITINKNDGSGNIVQTLNEGETYLVNGGVNAGATLTSTEPVQAHLVTGDVGAYYESRWFTLYPTEQWSNSYYSPVGTAASNDPTHIFVYNPDNANPLTVNYETLNGTSNFEVPAGGVYRYQMPANSGGRFFTNDENDKFYAIGAIDADDASNATHDWGFSLVPESNLTPTVVIGWGPGTSDTSTNGNPIWLTAADTTTVYVNYDGDSTTGALTDPNGKQYDISYDVNKLESVKISDPNDFDQTGMRIYTVDGTDITAAWGQDPSVAGAGSPYLDMGTTILPLPVASAMKDAALTTAGDVNGNGLFDPGDTIEYSITVNNDGVVVLGNVNITDIVPIGTSYIPGSTYISNSTFVNGTQVDDDSGAGSIFPLDDNGINDGVDAGFNIGNVSVGESVTLTFQMQIDAAFTGSSINNTASVDSDDEDFNLDVSIAIANEPSTTEFVNDSGTPVAFYEENETIYVQVTDPDPNNDINTPETIDVTITNPDTGDRETITLTETGNDTGVFESSIPSSTSSGQGVEDGTVYAVAGDSLEVNYADPGFTEDTSSDTVPAVAVPTDTKVLYFSETGDLDRIDPVNSNDTTLSTSNILELSGLVGVDFDGDTSGSSSPTNWNVVTGTGTTFNLIDENGSSTDFDLQIGTISGSAGGNFSATQIPSHTQSLALLDNNIWRSGTITATWSGLTPNADYDVYVFGLDTFANNQSITITGDNVASFNQNYSANNLFVNNSLGNSSNTIESYAESVTANGSGQIVIQASQIGSYTGLGGLAISPASGGGGGGNSVTFNQAISMTSNFEMPANAPISITSYIDVSSGTPTINDDIAATVSSDGGNIATFSNPTNVELVSGSIYKVTWQGTLASDVTVPTGQDISLDITNNQADLAFAVNYDSSTYPSNIELPTTTVIDVASLGVYDDTSANGGSLVDASFNGDTVYIRAEITDPFGDTDITGLDLTIDVPDGNQITASLDDTYVIDAPDDGTKIYEYEWKTGNAEGNYDISVVAQEGLETGDFEITDTAGTTFNLSALDLGTPSVTEFVDSGGNPIDTYTPLNSNIYLQVTDIDENSDPNNPETISATITASTGDSEAVILTETGNDTGVFEVTIPSSDSGGTTADDGTLNAPDGTVLSASYVDADNVLDNTGDTASVLAAPVATNEPPVATDDVNITAENAILNVNATNGVINLAANPDTDLDSDPLDVISVNGNSVVAGGSTINLPSGAIVTMNPDGSYDYDPNGQFNYLGDGQTATDTFAYTISDGRGGLDTATVTIDITGINEDPVANDDDFATLQGTAINISASGVTTNDSDPNGDPLTIDSITPATLPDTTANGGTVILNGNGTITYTPDPSFIGIDSFDYTIADGNGGTATATVNIEVQAAPIINLDPNNDSGGADDGNFENVFDPFTLDPIKVADLDAGDIANGLTDVDSPNLSSLNLTITGVQDGADEILNIGGDGVNSGIDFDLATNNTATITVGSTNFRITSSNNGSSIRIVNEAGGDIPQADLETLIQNITYDNESNNRTIGDRTIDFTTSDGAYGSNTVTSTITIPYVNQPPVNTIPVDQSTIDSADVVFSAVNGNTISVGDPEVDPASDRIQVTLDVTDGLLNLSTTNRLTVVAGADNSSNVTVEGTVNNINLALEGLTYTPNGIGTETITVQTNDLGIDGFDPDFFGQPHTGDANNEQDIDTFDVTNYASPTLDLDGDDALLVNDFATTYFVGGSPISVSDDVLIGDLDSANMQSASIHLKTRPDGDGAESLLVNGALPGVITTTGYDPVTGILELTGNATIAEYQTAIAQIEYSNSIGLKTDDRLIDAMVNDGISDSNIATTTIAIDAPPFIDLDGDDSSFI